MEETINIKRILKTLRKRLLFILVITGIAITISGVISFTLLTPIYQTSTKILVNQEKQDPSSFSAQDIQTDLQLINTYNVIIKSTAILSKVIEELDLEMTVDALYGQMTVSSEQNSQVLSITVKNPDPKVAVDIANTTATVFQEDIQDLMNVDNVNVLDAAELSENPTPIKPDPKLNMAIAAVIGLAFGIGLAYLLEYLDTTMKTEQDIEELLELPILGLISPIPDEDVENAEMQITQRRRR